nr:probable caffeoyl-CoA O-methyltransferase 2 isoform X2 [Ipomoea batatas]
MPPVVVEMDNVARLSEGHRRCSGAYGRRRPPPSSNLSSDDTDLDPHQLEETTSCLFDGRDCILVQILVLRDRKAAQQLFGPLTNREQVVHPSPLLSLGLLLRPNMSTHLIFTNRGLPTLGAHSDFSRLTLEAQLVLQSLEATILLLQMLVILKIYSRLYLRVLNEYPQVHAFSGIYNSIGLFGIQATTIRAWKPDVDTIVSDNAKYGGKQIISVTPRLYDYILGNVREPEILLELREETATMQVQGAKRCIEVGIYTGGDQACWQEREQKQRRRKPRQLPPEKPSLLQTLPQLVSLQHSPLNLLLFVSHSLDPPPSTLIVIFSSVN